MELVLNGGSNQSGHWGASVLVCVLQTEGLKNKHGRLSRESVLTQIRQIRRQMKTTT